MSHGCTESSVEGRYRFSLKVLAGVGLLTIAISPIGCGKKQNQAKVPVLPPPISAPAVAVSKPPASALPPAPTTWTQLGIASWYVPEPAGRKTASGEPYEGSALTAAHCTLPLNALVRVTNLSTHREAIV